MKAGNIPDTYKEQKNIVVMERKINSYKKKVCMKETKKNKKKMDIR